MRNLEPRYPSRNRVNTLAEEIINSETLPELNNYSFTDAINDLVDITQVDESMALFTILSALSVTFQSNVNVKTPMNEVILSMYIIIIAESGERKSTLHKHVFEGLVIADKLLKESAVEYIQKHTIATKIHEEKISAANRMLKAGIKSGKSTSKEEELISNLIMNKPEEPIHEQIFIEDTTLASLQYELYKNRNGMLFGSADGAMVLRSINSNFLYALNKLWSNEDIHVDRRTSESYTVSNTPLSLLIMTQAKGFKDFINKNGNNVRDSGFAARLLICKPPSKAGRRAFTTPKSETPGLFKFQLFTKNEFLKNKGLENTTVIEMSDEAKRLWQTLYDVIERKIGVGGRYEYEQDHASKLLENISRVAGLLYMSSTQNPQNISEEILEDAAKIVAYSSSHFQKEFKSNYIKQVEELLEFIEKYRQIGFKYLPTRFIQQRSNVRVSKAVLNSYLFKLEQDGEIEVNLNVGNIEYIALYRNRELYTYEVEDDLYELQSMHRYSN